MTDWGLVSYSLFVARGWGLVSWSSDRNTTRWEPPPPVYGGQMGSICHFPRALSASIWGHCSQILVFTKIWGTHTKRGVTVTLSLNIFWGKIFPPRENFPSQGLFSLENSFPFPSEWTVFPGNEGLGKKELVCLEGKFMTFPARENLPQAIFLSQKMSGVGYLGTPKHCKARENGK